MKCRPCMRGHCFAHTHEFGYCGCECDDGSELQTKAADMLERRTEMFKGSPNLSTSRTYVKLTDAMYERARELRLRGHTWQDIADTVGASAENLRIRVSERYQDLKQPSKRGKGRQREDSKADQDGDCSRRAGQ